MDVDDGLGGDDEVVAEMDVYLTQELAEQLYVFQYPLRPQWKPHEMASELKTVRHRALQRAVQLELQLDTSSPHYDGESQRPLETSMLSSTPVPAQTNHCVGVVSGGTVHLTPLHAVVQMRPSMAHLDEEDTARREEREREAKAEKRGARQDSAISVDANDDEDKADDDEMQMLQVQFRRAESEKVLERKRTSYASLHEAREKEPWAELAYHTRDSDESHMLRALLLCSSKAHIPFACGADDYLARLSCGRAHVRADGAGNQFGMPIDLEQARRGAPCRAAYRAVPCRSRALARAPRPAHCRAPVGRAPTGRRSSQAFLSCRGCRKRRSARCARPSAPAPSYATRTSCRTRVCASCARQRRRTRSCTACLTSRFSCRATGCCVRRLRARASAMRAAATRCFSTSPTTGT